MVINLGFLNLLTIIFVIAKLFGKIAWSWWLVFAPTWIPLAILIALCVLAFFIALINELS